MNEITTLEDLYLACIDHDYWYSYSDDHRVWQAGTTDAKRISQAAERLGTKGKQIRTAVFNWRAAGSEGDPPPFDIQ